MKQDFEMQPGKPTCLPQNGAISQGKSSSKHFFQGMRSVSHMFPIYFWLAWRQVCFFCAICVFFPKQQISIYTLKTCVFGGRLFVKSARKDSGVNKVKGSYKVGPLPVITPVTHL